MYRASPGLRPRRRNALAGLIFALVTGRGAAQDVALPRVPEAPLPGRPAVAQDVAPPQIPEVAPLGRPGAAVDAFVEGLKKSDATIEITLGHGRVLALKEDLAGNANGQPALAAGDPGVLDFTVLSPRQIRLLGTRLGSTDLSITTADGRTITFDVRVSADLNLLRTQLRQTFPDTAITLGQVGDHIVVEGEARDATQIAQILRTVRTSIASAVDLGGGRADLGPTAAANTGANMLAPSPTMGAPGDTANAIGGDPAPGAVKVLNLLRVPGSQQVLLKVRVAELNRTALRQIGANVLGYDAKSGSIFGTQIANPASASGTIAPFNTNRSSAFTRGNSTNSLSSSIPTQGAGLVGAASSAITSSTTMFGIFQNSNFDVFLNALRRNSVLKILAEPNVVALNGHRASFLAGGEFPIPVPQVGAAGVASTVTVNFKKFGVQLDFLPVILDGDTIRLTVDPEVSSIDFSIGTVLVAGGTQVPGLNTRNAHTTVELKEGQTLAIAGLMQLTLDGQTSRIPGLGDLPILGPFFSNTTSQSVEKELVVLVTPYLVEPLNADQVPPLPGSEVDAPNDLEFFLLNRIEGRLGRNYRPTTDGADPLRIGRLINLERKNVRGPFGYSD